MTLSFRPHGYMSLGHCGRECAKRWTRVDSAGGLVPGRWGNGPSRSMNKGGWECLRPWLQSRLTHGHGLLDCDNIVSPALLERLWTLISNPETEYASHALA